MLGEISGLEAEHIENLSKIFKSAKLVD